MGLFLRGGQIIRALISLARDALTRARRANFPLPRPRTPRMALWLFSLAVGFTKSSRRGRATRRLVHVRA